MCLYPKIIKNRKYLANKKNGGNIPAVNDKRTLYVPVGCGKCIECMKQKSREWQVRLLEEVKEDTRGKFVTLTFSDESISKLSNEIKGLTGYELDNEIATLATRRFLERWRKKYKKSVKHWLVTELGHNGTERLHLHGIIWTEESQETLKQIWGYGWIYPDTKEKWEDNYIGERTANYITKYITKRDERNKEYKPKILCSKGIGAGYTKRRIERNKYKGEETIETYKQNNGYEIALPIYYRNKIYTEEEREKLWIQKLNKEERWVCGVKIDVSKTDELYMKVLMHARKKNKRLGYGTDEKNWDKKRYENQKRQLKINNVIKSGLGKEENKGRDSGAGRIQPTAVRRDNASTDTAMKPNYNFNGE